MAARSSQRGSSMAKAEAAQASAPETIQIRRTRSLIEGYYGRNRGEVPSGGAC